MSRAIQRYFVGRVQVVGTCRGRLDKVALLVARNDGGRRRIQLFNEGAPLVVRLVCWGEIKRHYSVV